MNTFKTKKLIAKKVLLKQLLILPLLLLCLSLCGCSLTGLDAQGLISPPKANADQQAIHALLKDDEAEIKFIFPKNGEYRSAVIMKDFTGDGNEDALGFYADAEGKVTLKLMTNGEKGWSVLTSIKNAATQVDKVCFGDLTGDGIDEIIVGWGAPQSMTATIGIYTYSGARIKEFPVEESYNDMIITDLNSDGIMELFTATIFTKTEEPKGTDKKAVGKVFTLIDNVPKLLYSIDLNDTVVRYSSMIFSRVSEKKIGIVLDGVMADNSTVTQILFLNSKTLVSPLSGKSLQKKYNFFYRPPSLSIQSRDIDGDGIIEYPKISLHPTCTGKGPFEPHNYYVDWVKFNTLHFSHNVIKSTIMNIADNYYITIPEYLIGKISCDFDTPRVLTFRQLYLDENGKPLSSKKIFTIKAFTKEEWVLLRGSYILLKKTDSDMIYGYKTFENLIDTDKLIKSIELITK